MPEQRRRPTLSERKRVAERAGRLQKRWHTQDAKNDAFAGLNASLFVTVVLFFIPVIPFVFWRQTYRACKRWRAQNLRALELDPLPRIGWVRLPAYLHVLVWLSCLFVVDRQYEFVFFVFCYLQVLSSYLAAFFMLRGAVRVTGHVRLSWLVRVFECLLLLFALSALLALAMLVCKSVAWSFYHYRFSEEAYAVYGLYLFCLFGLFLGLNVVTLLCGYRAQRVQPYDASEYENAIERVVQAGGGGSWQASEELHD